MRRYPALCFFSLAVFATGCNNSVQQKSPRYDPFSENPITITWKGESSEVESYQANVQVFTMNNRTDTYATLNQTYRLAISTANDRVLTRIDFDYENDIPFRSVISDGENTIVFDPMTEEIGYRIQSDDFQSPLYRIFGQQTGLSRINLPSIREEASRLSVNMREENEDGRMVLLLEIPPALIPKHGNDTIISSRAAFDIINETLLETEVIIKLEDDTMVTTTVTPVYEDSNGIQIKIGQVTVIDSKTPELIEGVDPDIPIYNSPDDFPLISSEELAELEKTGNVEDAVGIIYGDPADLSNVETIYEIYQDIKINNTPEQLFRLLQK